MILKNRPKIFIKSRLFIAFWASFYGISPLAPTGVAQAQTLITASGAPIALTPGQGMLVKLDAPAASVFLANPDVADVELKSSSLLYLYARAIGSTTIFALDDQDNVAVSRNIAVSMDTDALNRAARAAVRDGAFSISETDGAVVVSGRVNTAGDADRLMDVVQALAGSNAKVVNSLVLNTPAQVNLRVQIAEVSRTVTQDLGIAWDVLSNNPTGLSGSRVLYNANVNVSLEALQGKGLVTILSEPNLTARSGDQATFLAGGRFPYQTENSNGETTVSFEPYGVELNFTPVVEKADQIRLAIETRVRDLDFSDASQTTKQNLPNILERSAQTTVELASGQSFAIAGLFKSSDSQNLKEVPGLAQVPIFGALFRSSRYSKGESELVIIVTPYLVEPTDRRNFKLPVDNFKPSNLAQRQLLGEFNMGEAARDPSDASVKNLKGRAGFVLQ